MNKKVILVIQSLFLAIIDLHASTITFPSSSSTFTENGHSFTVTGTGYVWNSDYRSASYCAINNSSNGDIIITKTSGNPFQLNHLYLKGDTWASVSISGYNGGSQLYTTGSFNPSGSYAQRTFSGWTGINRIVIQVSGNGYFAVDDIDYTVMNVAPTDISLSGTKVADGASSGTTVGTFSSTDPEDSGSHTYSFASGGTDNASFTISGNSLITAFTADNATKSSYSIKIRSTDAGSLYYEKDFTVTVTSAGTVWDGPSITFTKANYADHTQEANQDRITDNVWLTRQDFEGLFNIVNESSYVYDDSPTDTEWATGTTADYGSLTFTDWYTWHGGSPPSVVNVDAVLHLITDNIYIDIKFTSWSSGGSGGGFTYIRSTGGADATAPTLSGAGTSNIGGTTADASITSDEDGTAYYVVLAQAATAPTNTEVAAGTGSGGAAAVASGSAAVTASSPHTFNISGLSSETAYTVYMVAEDASNNVSTVSDVDFTTTDVTKPTLSGNSVTNITGTTADAAITSSENGTAYYVVLLQSASAPNSNEVKAGTGSGGGAVVTSGNSAVTSGVGKTFNISGLSSETTYTVYIAAEDASNNLSLVSDDDFTTADITSPTLSGTGTSNVTGTTAGASITSNEDGFAYYVVLTQAETAPTASEVEAGTGNGGAAAVASGNSAISAGAGHTFNISGLSSETDYTVYLVAKDGNNNLSTVTDIDFTTDDITAPLLTSTSTANLDGTTADALLTSNEDGNAYYVVLGIAETAPNATEVKAGTGSGGAAIVASGNSAVIANTQATFNMSGFTSETDYTVYLVAEDGSNNLSLVSDVDFTTADITAPTISGTGTSNVAGTTADASITSNEDGTAYFVVLTVSATAPTASEVAAGTGSGGAAVVTSGNKAVTSGVGTTFNISGLSSETDYTVYLIASDGNNNLSSVADADFTTTDITAPILSGLGTSNIGGTTTDIDVTYNESATAYMVVLPESSTPPNAAEVKAGTGNAGAAAIASASNAIVANTKYTFNVSGLISETTYTAYVISEDASANLSVVSDHDFTTADITAPIISGEGVDNVGGTTVDASVTSNEDGIAYYVVLALAETAPTSTEVVAGTGNGGAAVVTSGNASISAGASHTFNISGLNSEIGYTVYLVAVDGNSNESGVADVDFTTADITAPTISLGEANNVTGTTVDAEITANEDGTAYYVILELSETAPTISEVEAGTGSGGSAAIASGNNAIVANTKYTFQVSGLDSETPYTLYFIAIDGSDNKSNVTDVDFTTADITQPVLSGISVDNIEGNTADVAVTSNEDGNGYYVILAQEALAPDAEDIEAGTGNGGAVAVASGNAALTANTPHTFDITGLTSETLYTVYLIASDGSGNLSVVRDSNFETTDITSPILSDIDTSNVQGTSTDLLATSNETGTLYYVVLTQGASAPNSTEVKSGTGSGGAAAVSNGNSVVDANVSKSLSITGLSSETDYSVYLAAEDESGNISLVSQFDFLTKDITPPVISGVSSSNITENSADVLLTSNETGTIFYVFLEQTATAPTSQEVMDGTGSGGTLADASGSSSVTALTELTINATGLYSETNYTAYMVAVDVQNNISTVAETDFTTDVSTDFTAPEILLSEVDSVGGTFVDIDMTSNENGKFYFVVLGQGTTAPAKEDVYAGTGNAGATAELNGQGILVANVAKLIEITGLNSETDYSIYIVAEDGNNNLSDVTSHNISTIDITAPILSETGVDNITGTSSVASATSNENGEIHYAVLLQSQNVPTADKIVSGLGNSAASGSMITTPDEAQQFNISGLSSETEYVLYLVSTDDAGNLSDVASHSFTTADITGPTLSDSAVVNIQFNAAGAQLTSNEDGRAYYVVLEQDDTAPSNVEIIAGTGNSGATAVANGSATISANNSYTFAIGGLTSEVSYTVYLIATDTSDNSSSVVDLDFTTSVEIDLTPPVFSAPEVTSMIATYAKVSITSNEDGIVYYVVLESGDPAPTSADVVAGTGNGGSLAVNSGALALSADVAGEIFVNNLTAETGYTIYMVVADDSNNKSAISSTDFTTPEVDVTAPQITVTAALNVDENYVSISVMSNENASVHYVVVLQEETAPIISEIKDGFGSGGATPALSGSDTLIAETSKTLDFGLFAPGDYTVYYVATDASGNNTEIASANFSTIDFIPPVITINTGASLLQGDTVLITNSELSAQDDYAKNRDLVYEITVEPSHGHLEMAGNPEDTIHTFTQLDLVRENVLYIHNGSETTTDEFTFSVSDGRNVVSNQVFNIEITPVTGILNYTSFELEFMQDFINNKIYLNSNNVITEIRIYNISGACLINGNFNNNNISIDVSSLRNGIYLMKVNSNEKTKLIKFFNY